MSDQDEYPTCETCEHRRPATNHMTNEALMACLNGNAPTSGMEVPEDFGCILHSDLQEGDE